MALLRNTIITFIANFGVTLLGLLTSILFARAVGPYGRGLLATILIWPQMLMWAGGLSLAYANTYYGASQPELRRGLFANSLAVSLLLGAIMATGAVFIIPRFIHLSPHLETLLILGLILNIPVGIWTDYALGLLQSASRFSSTGIIRGGTPVILTTGYVALYAMHDLTVVTAVWTTWIGGFVSTALALWFLIRAGDVGLKTDTPLLRKSLSYSLQMHAGTLANLANGRLSQLIMTAMVGPKALGLFAFAVTLAELLKQFSAAISLALMPKIAGEPDFDARRAIAGQCVRWTLLISGIGAVGLGVISPFVIHLLWGSKFVESVPTVRILLPGVCAVSVASTLVSTLRGIGRAWSGTVAEIASLVVMVPLLLVLLKPMGNYGAGIATTVGNTINFAVLVFYYVQAFGPGSLKDLVPTLQDWHDARRLVVKLRSRSAARTAAVAASGGNS